MEKGTTSYYNKYQRKVSKSWLKSPGVVQVMKVRNDNGNLHSFDDKPAVVWADGQMEWYKDGKLHREYGPAVAWSNGENYWYINGKKQNLLTNQIVFG